MRRKGKTIRNVILGLIVVLAAAAMALAPLFLRTARQDQEDGADILSVPVKRGSVRTTISGGGALAGADPLKISVPHGVEITEYLVSNGMQVQAGQPMAAVEKVSVMQTIAVVQKNLEHLDKQMRTTPGYWPTMTLTAPASGRVKAIYAQAGDSVTEVMRSHGALLVVSLDGQMAVRTRTDAPAIVGESVTVTLSDGTQYPGRVELHRGDELTVTLTDNGPELGDTASVSSADGRDLGRGELTVHRAWNLTAVSGVVTQIYVKNGEQIYTGYGLCFLDQVAGSGKYDQLAKTRREYEKAMEELFALYDAGTVNAPEAGIVSGVDESRVGLMAAHAPEYSLVLLGAAPEPPPISPGDADPAVFQNKPAMVGEVCFGRITFLANPDYDTVKSYEDTPDVDYNKAESVRVTSFDGVQVYEMDVKGTSWTMKTASEIYAGQLVYLVYDNSGKLMWVLIPPLPETPSGGGGGGGAEPPFEMYDLTRTELFRLTPEGSMTVQVNIDELDIISVAPGQEAEITVDALPGRSFMGHVLEIDPKGTNNGGNTRYTVTIAVDREENMLAGMNATAILTVGVTEDILTLPVAALEEKGSRTIVYTGYDEATNTLLDPVEVRTGVSDGSTVEIVEGLSEGTEVWYSYYKGASMPELMGLPVETI